jgi:regulator of protease activity HflC (stomatin/prohibitin superfamily)
MVTNSSETTHTLPAQSLTTKDGKSIVVKGMVKYKVTDAISYFVSVWDAVDALSDISCGVLKQIITEKDWVDCADNEIDNTVAKKIRNQVKRYGIDVVQFTITDISQTKSLRLFNENISFG